MGAPRRLSCFLHGSGGDWNPGKLGTEREAFTYQTDSIFFNMGSSIATTFLLLLVFTVFRLISSSGEGLEAWEGGGKGSLDRGQAKSLTNSVHKLSKAVKDSSIFLMDGWRGVGGGRNMQSYYYTVSIN